MNLKRQECPQRSIRGKDSGQVEWICGLFWVLILAIVMYTRLQIAAWQSTAVYLEDALAASNLASALIDLEEYGKTHKVLIRDEQRAFEVYRDALKVNLQLDEEWNCANQELLMGPVEIIAYIIYNVDGDVVEIVQMNHDGQMVERRTAIKGSVTAPNGVVVEHTGVYSELKFAVSGFPGMVVNAQMGKLADIVPQGGEEDENG